MSKVCIVIVNYNGAKYQNDCIRTLYQMTYTDFDIVIIDSGSHDNSIELVKKEFPEVIVLEQKDNVGVAAGNNIGIKYGIDNGAEYTLLLNNDTEVDKQMLERLIENADERTITVPKIYYYEPSNVLWYAGGDFVFEKGTVNHVGCDEIDKGQYNKKKYVEYSPTCCMLIKNTVFEDVGLIDEIVFMYCDDTDFCVRLFDKDYKILYVPDSIVWHKVSSSSGGNKSKLGIYYMYRNQLYFMKKHKNHISKKTYYSLLLKNTAKGILSPFRKNKNEKYILTAYKDYYTGKMGRKDFDDR